MKKTLKNIRKKKLNNTFKAASFFIFQKMYLFHIEIGYTYQCSIRIGNNKKKQRNLKLI